MNEKELIEKLAELEHIQWEEWSKYIAEELKEILGNLVYGNISLANKKLNSLINRWSKNWKPYSDLSEEIKHSDRVYALKIIKLLKDANLLTLPNGNLATQEDLIAIAYIIRNSATSNLNCRRRIRWHITQIMIGKSGIGYIMR